MPKQKSRKALTNRLRITKTGKVMRRQGFRRHLKANKSQKRLRNLKREKQVTGFYAKRVRKSIGRKFKKAKVVKKS